MDIPLQRPKTRVYIVVWFAMLALLQTGAAASYLRSNLDAAAEPFVVPLVGPACAFYSSVLHTVLEAEHASHVAAAGEIQAMMLREHFLPQPISILGWLFMGFWIPLLAPRLRFWRRTDRKAALALKEVLELHDQPYLILSREGRVIQSTHAAQSLWGYSEAELMERTLPELGIPSGMSDDSGTDRDSLASWSAQDGSSWQQSQGQRKDGSALSLEFKAHPAKWGASHGYVMAVREKVKEPAPRVGGPFNTEHLPCLSHELRTPVNGIIGFCILLKNTALTPQQQSFIATIHSTAEQLLGNINDILDFSKLDSGKLKMERLNFNLVEVVENTLELLAERAHSKGVQVSSRIDRHIASYLYGDPWRLRQVLTNLVGNAIKFTEQGEVVVRVAPLESNGSHVKIRFEVSDTGVGIPEGIGAKLFEPYQQGTHSTARQYGGTGLGLAISKQLVELMGGEIGYNGVPGQGTTFWFTAELESRPYHTPSTRTTRVPKPGLHLMVVDYHRNHQQMVHDLLTPWGLRVDTACNSREALQSLRHCHEKGDPCQVVLMDLHLPDEDGLSLARAIKNDPALASSRLILLTRITDRLQSETWQSLGIADVLTKPARQKLLLDCIDRVMEESAAVSAQTQIKRNGTDSNGMPQPVSKSPARRRPLKILVVEDDPVNQKVAVGFLEMLGYCAQVAAHDRELFKLLEHSSPDLILMDCQLPGLDGFKLAGEIRNREKQVPDTLREHSYIVGMTANSQMWDREKCLAAGMDDYINKPLHLGELKSLIEKVACQPSREGSPRDEAAPGGKNAGAPMALPNEEADAAADTSEKADPRRELIHLFVEGAEKRIREMHRAMQDQEAFALEQAAHNLRGCAGSMGAEQMEHLCTQLEEQAQVCSFQQVSGLLAQLEGAFQELRFQLDQENPKRSVYMPR